MEKNNKFDAKGQLLFVDPDWVTGDTCLYDINNPYELLKAKTKLSNARKEFLLRLQDEGFVITYDKNDVNSDIIYLIMNDLAVCEYDVDIKLYKEYYNERIALAGGEKFNYPNSMYMEEYFLNPFFPAVFKNQLANGGIDKFLIETKEQVEIIKKFYDKYSVIKEYSDAFDFSIFQQLIETPTRYETYMRVLMGASGDVLGASLKYSRGGVEKKKIKGLFERHFFDEKSKYFLNSRGMFNYYSDGGNISFSQPRYSSEKQAILKAHGIDPNNPTIPSDILEVASSISQKCNRELGIICGMDFILNEKDNKWYYLENQAFPAIEEWAVTKDIDIPKIKSLDDYVDYCILELETRHDALMMVMDKKFENTDEGKGAYSLKI